MAEKTDKAHGAIFALGERIGRGLRPFAAPDVAFGSALDIIGLVPGLNIPAEIASGILSLAKRDYVGFGLSMAGLIPVEGEWAVALKIARAAHAVHGRRSPRNARQLP